VTAGYPRVGHDLVANPDQNGDEQDLEGEPSPAGATAKRVPQPGDETAAVVLGARCSSPLACLASDQRIGGAY